MRERKGSAHGFIGQPLVFTLQPLRTEVWGGGARLPCAEGIVGCRDTVSGLGSPRDPLLFLLLLRGPAASSLTPTRSSACRGNSNPLIWRSQSDAEMLSCSAPLLPGYPMESSAAAITGLRLLSLSHSHSISRDTTIWGLPIKACFGPAAR